MEQIIISEDHNNDSNQFLEWDSDAFLKKLFDKIT
jgi:hypothetical protein